MQRRLYLTQNENILRAMSSQSTVDPGASGTNSRTAVRGPGVHTVLDQAGTETTPGGATTGFSPSGSAFTPVTPKVKKDNSQRYFSPFRLVKLDQPITARDFYSNSIKVIVETNHPNFIFIGFEILDFFSKKLLHKQDIIF